MHPRRWKAFLRLKGETLVENDQEIMSEFTGFAKQLEKVGVDYSIVVSVDKGPVQQYIPKAREYRPIQRASSHRDEVRSGA